MMAINTHRQMLVSQSDGAKSMEKLSSGYRVNRASDDAAGLAISEKMRGQIRGLSQASRNAQDTISLIQVAEGALAESHSILQRMRELSVQSATDTNTDADRVELNNELQQLKNELDRIGNSTEFNTRKLIEGSAKGVAEEIDGTARINNNSNVVVDSLKQAAMFESIGSDKSWGFDGAFMLLKTNQTFDINNDPIYNAGDFKLVGPDGRMYDFRELSIYTTVNPGELEHGVIVAVTPEQFTFDPTTTVGGGIPNVLPNGTTFDNGVTVAEDVDDTKVDTVAAGSLLATGTRIVGDSIKIEGYTGLLNGEITFNSPNQFDLVLNGETITVSGNDIRTFALDDGTVLELDAAKETIIVKKGNIILEQDLASPLQPGTTITAGSTLSAASKLIGDVLIQANYRLTAGELGANVTIGNNVRLTEADVVKLNEGTILAKGSEITLLDEVELKLNVAGTEIGVIYDADLQILKVNGVVVAPNKTTTLDDGTVLINRGNGIVEVTTGKITMARDMVPASATPPLAGQNIASYKIAKDSTLMAGTEVASGTLLEAGTVVSEKNKPHYPGSVTLGSYGRSVQFSSNDGNRLEARYHEMKVTEGITFIFSRYEPASNNLKDSIMAQIGANSGQTTFVSMADMRSRALGVADVDIATKWGAATGIETVNNAVQRVSHQRALLGATQNRLEHTISNLDTAAENMQAAESRIRDVDMAREIMENTKQNILQQAAQAMLAQANQIPQNVLQLLR
jgi:flagellin